MRRVKFKVVHHETRKGTNWTLNIDQGPYHSSLAHSFKYVNVYTKGKTIHALKSTLGIFVFRTRYQAVKFVWDYGIQSIVKILHVRPIGRGKVPKDIARTGTNHDLIIAFYSGFNVNIINPPLGTICYPAVEVLD